MKIPAAFIDRDGTINEEMGYINHVSRFVLLPGVDEALGLLNNRGFHVVIITNQSGVARGYFPIELVHEVNHHMRASLERYGVRIDGVFFCPHHPRGSIKEYAVECLCRKPKIGLLQQAMETLEIDMAHSFVVGDRVKDVELARNANLKGIMVKTGYGRGEMKYILPRTSVWPDYVAEDLLDAVRWVLGKE